MYLDDQVTMENRSPSRLPAKIDQASMPPLKKLFNWVLGLRSDSSTMAEYNLVYTFSHPYQHLKVLQDCMVEELKFEESDFKIDV